MTTNETYTRQRALLEELSNAFGPTGHEGPVRAIVRRELTPLADAVETDGIGSLIARIGDESDGVPRVMLSAHMDEVGLMVRHITPEGFLTIQTLGGWLDQALINQRWIVMTRNGPDPRTHRHKNRPRHAARGPYAGLQERKHVHRCGRGGQGRRRTAPLHPPRRPRRA